MDLYTCNSFTSLRNVDLRLDRYVAPQCISIYLLANTSLFACVLHFCNVIFINKHSTFLSPVKYHWQFDSIIIRPYHTYVGITKVISTWGTDIEPEPINLFPVSETKELLRSGLENVTGNLYRNQNAFIVVKLCWMSII